MDAKMGDKDENGVGLRVIDNNGVSHGIHVGFDGEITYHEQDGYSDDPSERTAEESSHVGRARRFARYWVYRKRGYRTLDRWQNPDHITLAALAVAPLGPQPAEEYFGDYYQQFKSLYEDTQPVVDMPTGTTPAQAIYKKGVYVGTETPELDGIVAELLTDSEAITQLGEQIDIADPTADETGLPEFLGTVTETDPAEIPSLQDGLLVEAVSDLHVKWEYEAGKYRTEWNSKPPLDRGPDAYIEIFEYDPESLLELKRQIARHLLCQVRDRYLVMGIAPPEPFRLQGLGQIIPGTWYKNESFYEPYHEPHTEISTWLEEHTPEDAYEQEAEIQGVDDR